MTVWQTSCRGCDSSLGSSQRACARPAFMMLSPTPVTLQANDDCLSTSEASPVDSSVSQQPLFVCRMWNGLSLCWLRTFYNTPSSEPAEATQAYCLQRNSGKEMWHNRSKAMRSNLYLRRSMYCLLKVQAKYSAAHIVICSKELWNLLSIAQFAFGHSILSKYCHAPCRCMSILAVKTGQASQCRTPL